VETLTLSCEHTHSLRDQCEEHLCNDDGKEGGHTVVGWGHSRATRHEKGQEGGRLPHLSERERGGKRESVCVEKQVT
jgi:hypothetical protein